MTSRGQDLWTLTFCHVAFAIAQYICDGELKFLEVVGIWFRDCDVLILRLSNSEG